MSSRQLGDYLREIPVHTPLCPEEESTLAREYAAGRRAARQLAAGAGLQGERHSQLLHQVEVGQRARQRLIESDLRLVVAVARRYQGRGLSLLDLYPGGQHRPADRSRQV